MALLEERLGLGTYSLLGQWPGLTPVPKWLPAVTAMGENGSSNPDGNHMAPNRTPPDYATAQPRDAAPAKAAAPPSGQSGRFIQGSWIDPAKEALAQKAALASMGLNAPRPDSQLSDVELLAQQRSAQYAGLYAPVRRRNSKGQWERQNMQGEWVVE